jgi:cell division protease FtsH
MIHEYAMGTEVNSQRLADHPQSESARRVHDAEVRDLTDEAYRSAVDVLSRHRPQLNQLAEGLLARETLERKDIEDVLVGIPAARPDRRPGIHLGLAAATTPEARPKSE